MSPNFDKIQALGQDIREEILSWEGDARFSGDLYRACAVASYMLWKACSRLGIHVALIQGTYRDLDHCWVEYEGHVIDVTATQFGLSLPPIYIVEVGTDRGYEESRRNTKVLGSFRNCYQSKIKSFLSRKLAA